MDWRCHEKRTRALNFSELTIVCSQGGEFWPKPTFKVVAMDRPDEPLIAPSCTGCWTQVTPVPPLSAAISIGCTHTRKRT